MSKDILHQDENESAQPDPAKTLGASVSSLGRWERGGAPPDVADLKKLSGIIEATVDHLLFANVPRDGRVVVPDTEFLKLFEEFSTKDEKTRSVAKELLASLLFKKRVPQEFEKRGCQKENTR